MQYQTEILRFEEGVRSRHPSPDASIAAAQANVLSDAGYQIAVLVDLTPQLPYRSREIRSLVIKTYWASSGSIVARLRRALATANRHLIAFNQKAESGNKCAGNITCAVFSDDEAFLGQVGAAYAYVWHAPDPQGSPGGSQLELFPKRDRLLIPLGATVPPVINIGYTTMIPGSIVCLTTTNIAEAQAREAWQQALSLSKLSLITSHLNREFTGRTISGSIILAQAQASPTSAVVRLPAQPRPIAAPPRSKPEPTSTIGVAQPSRTPDTPPIGVTPRQSVPVAAPTPDEPMPEEKERDTEDEVVIQTTPPTPVATPGPVVTALEDEEPWEVPTPQATAPRIRAALASFRDTIEDRIQDWKARRRLRKLQTIERATTAERARLHQAVRTLLPGKVEDSRKAAPRTAPPEKPRLMAGLVLGFLLVVALITVTKYLQLGGPLRAEELLEDARKLRSEAYNSQDPQDWYALRTLANQITNLDPQNTEALGYLEEAREAAEMLQSAAMLDTVPILDLGTAPSPRRLLVAGGWVYILETATDAVIGLPLASDHISTNADGPVAVIRRGQNYMGEIVNHIVDIAWIGPGGYYTDGAVFIYSEGGVIFVYEPALGLGSISVQRIQGDLAPGNVTIMEAFEDRIYLVHRQLNQILMYEPVNGIYELPRPYFATGTAPDLQLTQDLAVDDRLYLLLGDSTLRTYFLGDRDPSFEMRDLPDTEFTPLVMAVEPDPDNGLVYLADSQQQRIMVLNKRGQYVRQYRLPRGDLNRIEALAVSPTADTIYLIAENKLVAAPLPSFDAQATQ